MKIIALLMVKNEEWILPTYLEGIKPLVDDIVAMDDGSTDRTKEILKNAGATVLENTEVWKSGTPEYNMRQKMLQVGRERGGTHFICLDADEVFSAGFRKNGREIIAKLKPGQKYSAQWLFLWKDPNFYIDDEKSLFKNNYKDLIFCDKVGMEHSYKFMHVGRTPGDSTSENVAKLESEQAVCLHFTFVNWKRCMMKQAWCRCSDLINEPGSYVKVNNRYYLPDQGSGYKLSKLSEGWLGDLLMPKIDDKALSWHYYKVMEFFEKNGIEFFEPLEIWDIQELYDEFVKQTGRKPKSSKMHIYLMPIIKIRRYLKTFFKK